MSLGHIRNHQAESEQRYNKKNLDYEAENEKNAHKEEHIEIGDLVKSLVVGGVNGATNTLVVIISSISSGIQAHQILALCISICVGDAIGMAFEDFLSLQDQAHWLLSQKQRKQYDFDHFLQRQKQQIIGVYTSLNYSMQNSKRISQILSTNKQTFIKVMMAEKLHLSSLDPSASIKCGLITFLSFLLFGILPILPFIITSAIMKQETQPWIAAICIGIAEFLGLGFFKASISGANKFKVSFQILIVCSSSTVVGYAIGLAFPH